MSEEYRRRLVRHPERQSITGVLKASWYRKPVVTAAPWTNDWHQQIESGAVPQAVQIGDHAVAWFDDELYAWVEARGRQRLTA